jgi:hypothetical protein
MGLVILLLSIALMFAAFFRTRFSIGLIALGMLADVLAFLNLFIALLNQRQNGLAALVGVACGLIFVVLYCLFVREWKKVIGKKLPNNN